MVPRYFCRLRSGDPRMVVIRVQRSGNLNAVTNATRVGLEEHRCKTFVPTVPEVRFEVRMVDRRAIDPIPRSVEVLGEPPRGVPYVPTVADEVRHGPDRLHVALDGRPAQ